MRKSLAFLVALAPAALAFVTPLAAQTKLGFGEVVGITAHPTGATLLKLSMDSCKTALCRPNITSTAATVARHGGTAFDSRLDGVWISTGKNLMCVDPRTCRVICKEIPAPFAKLSGLSPLPPVVGGLAMDQTKHHLYMADTANGGIHQVTVGDNCTFKARFCDVTANLPAGHILGGLAIDNVRRLLFVGSYQPATGATAVYVTHLDLGTTSSPGWCLRRCNLTDGTSTGLTFPPQCPSPNQVKPARITGLAFDSCRSMLYVTNGPWTTAFQFSKPGTTRWNCVVRAVKCCNYPSKVANDMFIGLAMLPSRTTSHGSSCASKNCGNGCPGMIQTAVGHPTVGNKDFAVRLTGAPTTSAPVYIGIGIGPCQSPGVSIGACGPVLVTLNPLIVAAVPMVPGLPPCGGVTKVPLPVPADYSGCGLTFSTQFVMGCKSLSGGGTAVSNCLEFLITGS